jgi:excisionase family DNA binding protein
MHPAKTVLTTGEVAKLCNVAPRTVSKWFDSGHLRGYRIPGSKDRRIPLDQLVRFMRAHGIPLNGLDQSRSRILVLDADVEFCRVLAKALADAGNFQVESAGSAFEAGAMAQSFRPRIMVVDVSLPDVNPTALVRFVHAHPDLRGAVLIGTAHSLTEGQGITLVHQGFAGWLVKPFAVSDLLKIVDQIAEPELSASV